MSKQNIRLFLLLNFFLLGCGQTDYNPTPNIESNYEINVTKSINILKREFGKNYIESYEAKDNRNIFVQIKSEETRYGYSLLHYDITKNTPKLIKTIVEQNSGEISGITLLPNYKIIYVRATYKGYQYYVRIYDYILQKEIRAYDIYNDKNLILSPTGEFFIKGEQKVDISDIYKETPPSHLQLYRDDIDEAVVDPANTLIWQDDSSISNRIDSLEDAINICKTKPKYNWRVPTLQDITSLMTHKVNPFTSPLFKDTDSQRYYHLQSLSYDSDNQVFVFLNWGKYVRCVADYNKIY